MKRHEYAFTIGQSYLSEGGRYRDRIKYQSRHGEDRAGILLTVWIMFVQLCLMRSFGELGLFLRDLKTKFVARVNAPKLIIIFGVYIILAMMATTVFK